MGPRQLVLLATAIISTNAAFTYPRPDRPDRWHDVTNVRYGPAPSDNEYDPFLPSRDGQPSQYLEVARKMRKSARRLTSNSEGTFKALVILIKFPEHDEVNFPLPPASHYQALCDGNSGSVLSYFQEQSFGKYKISCDVIDWSTAEQSAAYYANGQSNLLGNIHSADFFTPVLKRLDNEGTDWFQYDADNDGYLDAVAVIHSDFAAEDGYSSNCNAPAPMNRIYSQGHQTAEDLAWASNSYNFWLGGYSITSVWKRVCSTMLTEMGVVAHEWTHTFGMMDLYDARTSTGKVGGTGNYDIMSNPYGPLGNASLPGSMSPFTKMLINWLTPTEITQDGTYTIRASNLYNEAYIINASYPADEYLLIENRQPTSFDSDLYAGGLLIFHVDNTKDSQMNVGYPGQYGWPANNNHYHVALLQADGNYDLEKGVNNGDAGDFWTQGMTLGPGPNTYPNTDSYQNGKIVQTGITITDISASGTTMTFRVSGISSSGSTPGPITASTPSPVKAPTPPTTLAPTGAPNNPLTMSPTSNPITPPTPIPTLPSTPPPVAQPASSNGQLATASPQSAPSRSPELTTAPTLASAMPTTAGGHAMVPMPTANSTNSTTTSSSAPTPSFHSTDLNASHLPTLAPSLRSQVSAPTNSSNASSPVGSPSNPVPAGLVANQAVSSSARRTRFFSATILLPVVASWIPLFTLFY